MGEHTTLGAVCNFLSGNAWKAEFFSDMSDGVPIIRIQNLGANENEKFVYWNREYQEKYLVQEGDILVSLSGSFKAVRWNGSKGLLNQRIVKVIPHENVAPRWLTFFLERSLLLIARMGRHALVSNVALSDLKNLPVDLPQLTEQHRVVDILSRAEGIVRLRREAEKKTDELIPALFFDMFGDPATNPKGWPVDSLGEHVEIVSAVKTPSLDQDAALPCIGADSIESHTGKLISLPTVNDVRPISGKYQFKVSDVLYSKIRPYLAKASLAPCEGYCSADMYPLSCNPSLRADFLLALLLSKSFTDYATAESVRAQMPKLNRQTLFAYKFPVPPVELQELFSERASFAYSIQSQQSAATATAQANFDALLTQVFGN